MVLQTLPESALRYSGAQRAEIGAAVYAVSRLWRGMGRDFDGSYARLEPALLAVLFTAQERVADGALAYVPDVLGDAAPEPVYESAGSRFVGVAGDGLPVASMAYGAVIQAKQAVSAGLDVAEALARGGRHLTLASGTLLSDTGRSAEKVSGGAHKVRKWTRMLNPPSCGRCVILAGKTSWQSEAFNRHPGCDCRNVPVSEDTGDDARTDPKAYLDSLSTAEQDRLLGSKANGQAFRDGADMNQLINAYRRAGAVRPAQINGRNIKFTREGTTRRGHAYWQMSQAQYIREQSVFKDGSKYKRLKAPRLMPETIYSTAKDPADAKRLLKLYGWIV
ncbi:hypothetical protein AB0N65_11790 [Paenarthrobacter sp. NPDC089322]|uniref:hypothetical protein n=1 Tax=Paenarthrobacter sp. NPDC089322 TaxID=3155065 RepID=UPI003436D1E4